MSVAINTNVDSLKIQNCLTNSTTKLSEAMQRLSSGLKINSAKDDAAGTVISSRMNVQLSGNKICQNNVQNANAMLATAEGNIDVVLDNVSRIRDLTLQAKNGTYSEDEILAMQEEVDQRIAEINRVSDSAKYSQLSLFEDKDGLQTNGATFQVGANSSDDNVITADKSLFASVKFSAITKRGAAAFKLKDMKPGDGNVSGSYGEAIDQLDEAIKDLTARKSKIGSAENRLESTLDTLVTQYTNLSASKSVITDADMATEASNFTKQQILQQVSTSLLAQANQAPAIAISLI